jgi:ring-1,2-phenylacetyl-CoA epoxidase subunit PaaE
MSNYYNLKVKEVIKETEDAITIVFEQPKNKILYKPGQFLTLILSVNGEKLRRSYSLCTAPETDTDVLAVTVKQVINGKASNYLTKNIKKGHSIEVMEPMGTFTADVNPNTSRDIVLIGAGSGITPLMSIVKTVLVKEPLSNVYLIYGNRNESSIIFKSQLNDLKKEHGQRFNIVHVLSQPANKSDYPWERLNRSVIIKILESFAALNSSKAEYFICGPEGMMEEARHALDLMKIQKEKIHSESFVASSSPVSAGEVVSDSQITTQEVTIVYQGDEYKITVPPQKTILQTALDQNIDLPYSCQSGMCTACMGKCVSGKVKLDESDGLSDKEIQQGYVLLCVGHPVTSDVVIEVD